MTEKERLKSLTKPQLNYIISPPINMTTPPINASVTKIALRHAIAVSGSRGITTPPIALSSFSKGGSSSGSPVKTPSLEDKLREEFGLDHETQRALVFKEMSSPLQEMWMRRRNVFSRDFRLSDNPYQDLVDNGRIIPLGVASSSSPSNSGSTSHSSLDKIINIPTFNPSSHHFHGGKRL